MDKSDSLTNVYWGYAVNTLIITERGHIFAGIAGCGVIVSTDSGKTWTELNDGLTDLFVISLAINSRYIFAGTNTSGVFRLPAIGGSWTQVNAGLTNFRINTLATHKDEVVFAGTDEGVFRSMNDGSTWVPFSDGLTELRILSIAINLQTRDIFAGAWGGGVLRSTINGNTWTELNNGLTNLYVQSLAINYEKRQIFAGTFGSLFQSTDDGQTWIEATNTGLIRPPGGSGFVDRDFAINCTTRSIFMSESVGGIYHSANNGESWTQIIAGIPNPYGAVSSLAINSKTQHLFAGTSGVWVYRSTNNGDNWTESGSFGFVRAFAVNQQATFLPEVVDFLTLLFTAYFAQQMTASIGIR